MSNVLLNLSSACNNVDVTDVLLILIVVPSDIIIAECEIVALINFSEILMDSRWSKPRILLLYLV